MEIIALFDVTARRAASLPIGSRTVNQARGQAFQSQEVRAFPIDFATIHALEKFVIIVRGFWRDFMQYLLLGNGPDFAITTEAAMKGFNRRTQFKPPYHFPHLCLRVTRANEIAMAEAFMEKQAPVSGENDALLLDADIHNLSIVEVIAVANVKPQ